MHIFFQNLKKCDQEKRTLFNVRGSIAKIMGRGLSFRYQALSRLWSPLGVEVECYGGDGNDEITLHLSLLIFQCFLTVGGLLKGYKKDKNGSYLNPHSTGFMFHKESGRIEIWKDQHETRSDKSDRIFYYYWCWPWDYGACVTNQVRNKEGKWVDKIYEHPEFKHMMRYPFADGRKVYKAPYVYTLRNGEKQMRSAVYYETRRVWYPRYQRWPFMGWAKWPSIVNHDIDISFNDEVGERSGSWKGGTVGCGYSVKPGESPDEALRRMEEERIFR